MTVIHKKSYKSVLTVLFFLFNTIRQIIFFFFFSSRRRHTRFDCDWSSDVCSSDLQQGLDMPTTEHQGPVEALLADRTYEALGERVCSRSEERRVGKECRSRWSP